MCFPAQQHSPRGNLCGGFNVLERDIKGMGTLTGEEARENACIDHKDILGSARVLI